MIGPEADREGGTLLIGEDERGIVIAAVGHIRANDCYSLREEVFPDLDSRPPLRDYSVDLSRCTYMDSTFIGLLVALDKRILRAGGARLTVCNPTPECTESLQRLGLDRILLIENRETPLPFPPRMRVIQRTGKPGAEFILKAHEALMETSAEAKKRFGLVMELLAKKLKGG